MGIIILHTICHKWVKYFKYDSEPTVSNFFWKGSKMKWISLVVSIFMVLMLDGCNRYPFFVHDYDTYSSGKVKYQAEIYHFGDDMQVTQTSEYYESGRLKSEEWSEGRSPVLQLEFYNNGQLKAEERYRNGEVSYGAYYKEDGSIEKIVGKRLRGVSN